MNHHLSRRSFLRGLGVSMALPWLESLPVWGDEPRRGPVRRRPSPAPLPQLKGPRRSDMRPVGPEPLTPYREKPNFIRGLQPGRRPWHSSHGNLTARPYAGGEVRSAA